MLLFPDEGKPAGGVLDGLPRREAEELSRHVANNIHIYSLSHECGAIDVRRKGVFKLYALLLN